MYLWSGNILYPMLAHFANNGFQVAMLYLYKSEITSFNIDETESVPWDGIFYIGNYISGFNSILQTSLYERRRGICRLA